MLYNFFGFVLKCRALITKECFVGLQGRQRNAAAKVAAGSICQYFLDNEIEAVERALVAAEEMAWIAF